MMEDEAEGCDDVLRVTPCARIVNASYNASLSVFLTN